jgi:hypothetical protein
MGKIDERYFTEMEKAIDNASIETIRTMKELESRNVGAEIYMPYVMTGLASIMQTQLGIIKFLKLMNENE